MSEYEQLFVASPPPDEFVTRARERGWPEELVSRMLALRFGHDAIERWLRDESLAVEAIIRHVETYERLNLGTLRRRVLTYEDGAALTELFANAPEQVGEWTVTVHRDPNPFAQFELFENPAVAAVEDRRVLLGTIAIGVKHCLVQGEHMNVRFPVGLRVRREARGMGLTRLLMTGSVPVGQPQQTAQVAYVRVHNEAVVGWLDALWGASSARARDEATNVPGIAVTVSQYAARALAREANGIRSATPEDVPACVELINRTHDGLDLFRPYTTDHLHARLNQRLWGPRPVWWKPVYGWDDFFVLCEGDAIVACAGLWDRGRDIREVWTHPQTTRTVADTNVLHFGYETGSEDAMSRLIEYLLVRTADRGRDHLVVPLQFLPDVAARLAHLEPLADTRGLLWTLWRPDGSNDDPPRVRPIRPYTDLAYW